MTIFRTQILAIASNLGYVVAPPLQRFPRCALSGCVKQTLISKTQISGSNSVSGSQWRPGNPFQSQNEMVCVLNSTIIPRICKTFALYRGIGLHKVAKFENEQQELRFPQTHFDTKMPAGHTVLQPFADDFSN
ncbi:hypothetical protein F2Q70_00018217 [Brassica cretica]|uniref:Uncharacterized protein n=1 Tax=Brassica cretica TaxID=69181 RepID=A0A8S9HZX8_BRACR|nr:hypothetical protein F2Q70_00018217 [Brassica cretica]KAF2598670.1 hypothetical protein F2Q68_00011403 [Brassica cretica]